MAVEFHDYTIRVKDVIDDGINVVLEECSGELESQVKRNSRVDTGKTKNSFRHKVDEEAHVAYIGSSDENAIWEEFGKKFLCRIKIGQNRLNFMGNMVQYTHKLRKAKLKKQYEVWFYLHHNLYRKQQEISRSAEIFNGLEGLSWKRRCILQSG